MKFNFHASLSNCRILLFLLLLSLSCLSQDVLKRTSDCGDKDYDCLIAKCSKEIENNPKNSDAYYKRGRLYQNRGNKERAIENYNEAIEINPNNIDAYHQRALSYYSLQRYDLALKDLNKLVEINPKDHASLTFD